MKDTEYTFAVAHVRANESKLLSSQELSAIIASGNYEEAVRRLNEKGYEIDGSDYASALEKRKNDILKLICDILPDKSQFDSIFIDNDFQNLKTVLKGMICDKPTDGLLLQPTVYDAMQTAKNIRERKNSSLPLPLQHADRSAYRILTQTGFAQLADSVVDRACLEWSIKLAEKADNRIMVQIAQTKAALADIKILYRCIKADKAVSFMERCVAECDAFDKSGIIKAASDGMESFFAYLSKTDFAPAVDALKDSTTAFEKWADDKMLSVLEYAKTEFFGIAPIVAYYFAAQTEIGNVRIILSAKHNGFSDDTVRERVRAMYV